MLPHEGLRPDVARGAESASEPSLRPFDREAWKGCEQQYQPVTIALERDSHLPGPRMIQMLRTCAVIR
jgi:hypothetical protein